MTIPNSAHANVHFSQVREDPELELSLVDDLSKRFQRPLRALVVGSGGCTALSLLTHPNIERVDAIDINAAQLHLIELRRQAIKTLTLDEQLRFIGEEQGVPRAERLEQYARIRADLPTTTRDYWDTRKEQIEKGIQHIGQFELLLVELKNRFSQANIDPIAEPAKAMGMPSWPKTFQDVFDRTRLQQLFGAAMVGYSVSKSFAHHFSGAFAHALREFYGQRNYFLNQIFRSQYDGEPESRPPYLQQENQEAIQKHGVDRLFLHHGNFEGTMLELAAKHGPYDLIQTSDLTDWVPITGAHNLLKGVSQSLGEGGALLARRLNADHNLSRLVQNHLDVDAALSALFSKNDRSFLYSEIVVGFQNGLGEAA